MSDVLDANNYDLSKAQGFRKNSSIVAQQMGEAFLVKTDEGNVMQGQPGDFLCMSPVDGRRWVLKQDYFLREYEKVPEELAGDVPLNVVPEQALPQINAELETLFTYHAPRPDQRPRYVILRALAKQFAQGIMLMVENGKERGVAVQKVREAVMWANAGIAMEKQTPKQIANRILVHEQFLKAEAELRKPQAAPEPCVTTAAPSPAEVPAGEPSVSVPGVGEPVPAGDLYPKSPDIKA